MSISEKIKEINDKIKQNQVQYNLDRQTAGFLHETGKFVLSESRVKSNLIYSKEFTFYKYHTTKQFAKLSFDQKEII